MRPVRSGPIHQHLAVEAAGAQQRRIEDLRPVGGGEQDEAAARVEAVELRQKLVEGLFLLVVAADAGKGAAGPAERVELVDEDDRGRLLARLLEQVAHPRGADADEHLDEFRAVDREERHAGLARHRAREQGLAGPRRADQQHALGDARAEPAVCASDP